MISNLEKILGELREIEGFSTFLDEYLRIYSISNRVEFISFLRFLKKELQEKNQWDEMNDLKIKITIEKLNDVTTLKNGDPLSHVNESLSIDENWIDTFIDEISKCTTDEYGYKQINIGKYKTIKEYDILIYVDNNRFRSVFVKYQNSNHPYVNGVFAEILLTSNGEIAGLKKLMEGLKYVGNFPNYYWNNKWAIFGEIKILLTAVHYFDDYPRVGNKYFEILIKLLKLSYLYLSRYIYMTNSDMLSIDVYSFRASLVKNFYNCFVMVFDGRANPDIQYISDKYLAHQCAHNHKLDYLGREFYNDSMKMYQHGSHIPNDSGGYNDFEEKTWMQCVKIGEFQSHFFASGIFEEFQSMKLNLLKEERSLIHFKIFQSLKNKNP